MRTLAAEMDVVETAYPGEPDALLLLELLQSSPGWPGVALQQWLTIQDPHSRTRGGGSERTPRSLFGC